MEGYVLNLALGSLMRYCVNMNMKPYLDAQVTVAQLYMVLNTKLKNILGDLGGS